MKKIIALLLALVMCFSCVACASNDKQPVEDATDKNDVSENPVETQTLYKIGDTITTDAVEVTLTSVEFQESYNNCVPENGQFVVVEYTVKSVAKTDILFSTGYTPTVDYNDGYIFNLDRVTDTNGNPHGTDLFHSNSYSNSTSDAIVLKPLSDTVIVKVAIAVPTEVVENTDAPLIITMNIPVFDGSETTINKPYNFSVR